MHVLDALTGNLHEILRSNDSDEAGERHAFGYSPSTGQHYRVVLRSDEDEEGMDGQIRVFLADPGEEVDSFPDDIVWRL